MCACWSQVTHALPDAQVERTSAHLLGKAVLLDVYAERGWHLVGAGLDLCFPCLLSMSNPERDALQREFIKEATAAGKSWLNADDLVVDKQDSCKVIPYKHAN